MNKSYTILADHYDLISDKDCDYDGWSQYLFEVAQKHNVKTVVDIACGTGKMTERLAKFGLQVVGVDASCDMLAVARQKNIKANFVMQDMRKLVLPRPVDMAVAVNDAVNYLKSAELASFFATVGKNLKAGAPFVFDFSSPYKLKNVVGNNVFYYDDDRTTLLWTNKFGKDCVKMQLTLFEKQGENYCRFDEQHTQYVHTTEDIVAALDKSGFDIAEVSNDYGKQMRDDCLRVCVSATKREV